MSWHATDVLGDSYSATKALLLPFVLTRWVILGIVVFFVGWSVGLFGSVNIPSGVLEVPAVSIGPDIDFVFTGVDFTIGDPISAVFASLIALVIAGVALLLGIGFAVVASMMQFVFVRQLTDREIRIRGYFGESFWPGIRLFGFWVGIGLVLLALFFVMIVLTIVTFGLFLVFMIFLIPVFFLGAIGLWVVFRFTFDFVVPIMLVDDIGVLQAWGELYEEIRMEWKQYGLYALIRFFLDIGAGILLAVGGAVVLLLFAIPALIIGLSLYGAISLVSSTVAAIVAGIVAVATLIAVGIVTTVVIGVPVHTYLRYYSLYVLGRISPRYDMLAEVRSSIE